MLIFVCVMTEFSVNLMFKELSVMRKKITVYVKPAQSSPSLYIKWHSMKNELCINSLTKKPKKQLFQITDCTIMVLNNYYYTS